MKPVAQFLQPINLGACHQCVFSRLTDNADFVCDNPTVHGYFVGIKPEEINVRTARENVHLCGPEAVQMHIKGE